jgi:cation diffusion facilitator family transporter
MHSHHIDHWTHGHAFHAASPAAERGTRLVMWITLVTMVAEIGAGWWSNSMALLADGWHMSSHALALGLSAFAYAAARRYANDRRFTFGTWKIEVLGGFSSAVLLLGVGVLMAVASVERLIAPQPVQYAEAFVVTVLGLLVNLACAWVLSRSHDHPGHGHHEHHAGHAHGPAHGHVHEAVEDLNLKAATVHVVADAATSVLAIVALAGGWWFGWRWLDPAMGLVGAVLVGRWALTLIGQTGRVLLDREMDDPVVARIRALLAPPEDPHQTRIADLHVWRVGRAAYACAVTLVTHDDRLTPQAVRERLSAHPEIAHTTVEIHRCCPERPADAG